MTQRLDRLNVNVVNAYVPSPTCDKCGSFDHVTMHYKVGNSFAPSSSEQVVYVNNFQPRPNHDPHSNTCNPCRNHHLEFSYKNEPLSFPQPNARASPLDFKDHPFLHHRC